MNFKTLKKLISCALPAWLLLGSGQNLIGSARFWSVPARFWSVLVGSCYIKYDCIRKKSTTTICAVVLRTGKLFLFRYLTPLDRMFKLKSDTFEISGSNGNHSNEIGYFKIYLWTKRSRLFLVPFKFSY